MLFSKNHIWIKKKEGIAKIGVSDYTHIQLGGIVFVNLPDVGDQLKIGESFGDIEGTKTVLALLSPIDGVILKTNIELTDMPEIINSEPYESWLIEAKIDKMSDELMSLEDYERYKDTLQV